MNRKSRAKPPSPFRYFNSSPEAITTDGLLSYKAATSELGNPARTTNIKRDLRIYEPIH